MCRRWTKHLCFNTSCAWAVLQEQSVGCVFTNLKIIKLGSQYTHVNTVADTITVIIIYIYTRLHDMYLLNVFCDFFRRTTSSSVHPARRLLLYYYSCEITVRWTDYYRDSRRLTVAVDPATTHIISTDILTSYFAVVLTDGMFNCRRLN